ncbi:LytR/AlgR family response regulator transcription factor [Pyxidicoccus sp. MSG2]|uniref:LytR/AlgR family response regulator transcription factor n=1 Tax=Pyxidicoccus sp. MSG2 TaxID=2996790 RepID=UPI00226E1E49|nr:LytTR family DNA-binding domain-containing protein [Pyxidicoccus sp. MSG2]MCY1019330.1 LytTR family DNA-binding domain-containing protein [Pyxidicoccus sp. MSG2]
MKVRTLIVDDEPLARERLRALLAPETDLHPLAECGDGQEALSVIARERPALVFLDVEMPEKDGFGVLAETAGAPPPVVVFVTAWPQHAVRAFEAAAVDYLLKPFTVERFRRTLVRVRERLASPPVDLRQQLQHLLQELRPVAPGSERLVVKSGAQTLLVPVEDIDWVESAGNYVTLHVGREEHLLRETLAELEARLASRRFARVHRSALVNVDRIHSLSPTLSGDHRLLLRDGRELTLSRTYRARLEQVLGHPL